MKKLLKSFACKLGIQIFLIELRFISIAQYSQKKFNYSFTISFVNNLHQQKQRKNWYIPMPAKRIGNITFGGKDRRQFILCK